jgi:hypothetical protein
LSDHELDALLAAHRGRMLYLPTGTIDGPAAAANS